MNKSKLYMICSIIVLILSIGGSLAWYVWKSVESSVAFQICAPVISFIGGETLNGTGIKLVTSKENGLRKQLDVYLNKTCEEGDSAVMNLYMTLDLLPSALANETFVYEVWSNDEMIANGNFEGKKEGDTIEILTNEVITEDDTIYLIYVYIDGTKDNPIEMAGKSFRFNLYGEGRDAIYKENTIYNPSTP